jgi:hypothetical protein
MAAADGTGCVCSARTQIQQKQLYRSVETLISSTLKMEVTRSSETSIYINLTRLHIPENGNPNKTSNARVAQKDGFDAISNIEIPERFQSKALRMIVDAPW